VIVLEQHSVVLRSSHDRIKRVRPPETSAASNAKCADSPSRACAAGSPTPALPYSAEPNARRGAPFRALRRPRRKKWSSSRVYLDGARAARLADGSTPPKESAGCRSGLQRVSAEQVGFIPQCAECLKVWLPDD
jgi:hypothetical protein